MNDLDLNDLAALRDTVNSHGWTVVLKLMEAESIALQGEWLEADPANPQAVWAAQAVARGYYIGKRNVLAAIQEAVRQYHERLAERQLSPEDEVLQATLNPF